MRKPVKCGEDFLRDESWSPLVRTREGAECLGRKVMPVDLKRLEFGVSVFEANDYYRISFGRKV